MTINQFATWNQRQWRGTNTHSIIHLIFLYFCLI